MSLTEIYDEAYRWFPIASGWGQAKKDNGFVTGIDINKIKNNLFRDKPYLSII